MRVFADQDFGGVFGVFAVIPARHVELSGGGLIGGFDFVGAGQLQDQQQTVGHPDCAGMGADDHRYFLALYLCRKPDRPACKSGAQLGQVGIDARQRLPPGQQRASGQQAVAFHPHLFQPGLSCGIAGGGAGELVEDGLGHIRQPAVPASAEPGLICINKKHRTVRGSREDQAGPQPAPIPDRRPRPPVFEERRNAVFVLAWGRCQRQRQIRARQRGRCRFGWIGDQNLQPGPGADQPGGQILHRQYIARLACVDPQHLPLRTRRMRFACGRFRAADKRAICRQTQRPGHGVLPQLFGWRGVGFLIPQAVQVGDEIAHMGIVDRALRFVLPRVIGSGIIGEDPHHMQVIDIFEDILAGIDQLTSENKMQALGHGEGLLKAGVMVSTGMDVPRRAGSRKGGAEGGVHV